MHRLAHLTRCTKTLCCHVSLNSLHCLTVDRGKANLPLSEQSPHPHPTPPVPDPAFPSLSSLSGWLGQRVGE